MCVITSASSRKDGITFYSKHYKLEMNEKSDGSIEYTSKKLSNISTKSAKCNIFLIRGFITFFSSEYLALIWILQTIIELFNIITAKVASAVTILASISFPILTIIIVILSIAILKVLGNPRKTSMYHGAEHKVINALQNGNELTLFSVRNEPCYSAECGSIFVVFCLLIIMLFVIFVPHWIFFIPLCYAIAYEMFIVKDGEHKPILKYAYSIGKFCQEKIVTKEPDDEMISNAIIAVNKLIELENSAK